MSLLRRLLCAIVGHEWGVFATADYHGVECLRCGICWRFSWGDKPYARMHRYRP